MNIFPDRWSVTSCFLSLFSSILVIFLYLKFRYHHVSKVHVSPYTIDFVNNICFCFTNTLRLNLKQTKKKPKTKQNQKKKSKSERRWLSHHSSILSTNASIPCAPSYNKNVLDQIPIPIVLIKSILIRSSIVYKQTRYFLATTWVKCFYFDYAFKIVYIRLTVCWAETGFSFATVA